MSKPLTQEEFINKVRITHKNRYNLTYALYVSRRNKVKVVCQVHGDFTIEPDRLYRGSGCKVCGQVTQARVQQYVGTALCRPKNSSFKKFAKRNNYGIIERFRKVHKDMYNYSDVGLVHRVEHLVSIGCKVHGQFLQSAHAHLSGNGCPKCAKPYQGTNNIETTCGNGHTYTRSHYEYFTLGRRCPTCFGSMFLPVKEVQERLQANELTLKTNGPFYRGQEMITAKCEIHGDVTKRLSKFMSRPYCGQCSKGGFRVTKPAYLYYLSVNQGEAYKIGVTNHSVLKRYSKGEHQSITILREWYFENGQECLNKEQEIIKKFAEAKYTGEALLRNGNTELFNQDILQLDITL